MKDFYNKLLRVELNSQTIIFAFIFILFSYSYQSVLPAYNADDVIQLQEISNDSYTFLGSGRWGYFFVFKYFLQASSGGLFATFFGCLFLLWSSLISSRVIGFKSDLAKILFAVTASVSMYYGFLFAFDSTRLAYPIAIFLAIFGFYQSTKSRYFSSIILLSISLSFYQSAIQVVATVFLISLMYRFINNNKEGVLRYFLLGVLVLLSSMVMYLLLTKVIYYFMGFSLTDRVSIDLFAFLDSYPVLISTLLSFVFPVYYELGSYYIDWQIIYPLFLIFIGFLLSLYLVGLPNKLFVLLIFFFSLLSTFALAFVSREPYFPPRSLIAIASLHAAWLAISVDLLVTKSIKLERIRPILVCLLTVIGVFFVSMHSMQINKKSLDDHLVSQEDLLATNRVISRIEQVAFQSLSDDSLRKVPLVVVYDQALPAGPRGDVGTARSTPWSKEWIFRLIDSRYVVADKQTQDMAVQKAQSMPTWPAPDSVFLLDNGAVVVKIN